MNNYKIIDDYESQIVDFIKRQKVTPYAKNNRVIYVLHICRIIENSGYRGNKKNTAIQIILTLNPELNNYDLDDIDELIEYFHINGYFKMATFIESLKRSFCIIYKNCTNK